MIIHAESVSLTITPLTTMVRFTTLIKQETSTLETTMAISKWIIMRNLGSIQETPRLIQRDGEPSLLSLMIASTRKLRMRHLATIIAAIPCRTVTLVRVIEIITPLLDRQSLQEALSRCLKTTCEELTQPLLVDLLPLHGAVKIHI